MLLLPATFVALNVIFWAAVYPTALVVRMILRCTLLSAVTTVWMENAGSLVEIGAISDTRATLLGAGILGAFLVLFELLCVMRSRSAAVAAESERAAR